MEENEDRAERYDVLCPCGWEQLAQLKKGIPEFCPVCGFDLWEYTDAIDAGVSPEEAHDYYDLGGEA